MKVIVAGGRDFIPNEGHEEWLISTLKLMKATHVVCGMARGADIFGLQIAEKMGLSVLKYPADWDKYGKSAGYKRNEQMAKVADACILFPGGKGTGHMSDIARKKGLIVWEWLFPQ